MKRLARYETALVSLSVPDREAIIHRPPRTRSVVPGTRRRHAQAFTGCRSRRGHPRAGSPDESDGRNRSPRVRVSPALPLICSRPPVNGLAPAATALRFRELFVYKGFYTVTHRLGPHLVGRRRLCREMTAGPISHSEDAVSALSGARGCARVRSTAEPCVIYSIGCTSQRGRRLTVHRSSLIP